MRKAAEKKKNMQKRTMQKHEIQENRMQTRAVEKEKTTESKTLKNKMVYLEVLRVISLFFVIYTHTGTLGEHYYMEAVSVAGYRSSLFLVAFSQICVPLFFMISGVLLLNRQESFRQVYKHRILRMVIVILLAVLLQFYCNYLDNPAMGFSLKSYLEIAYSGGAITQQWFLYAYLAFLMILPFLQRFVQAIPRRSWFIYLFVLWEIMNGICPILEFYWIWDRIGITIPLFVNIIFYSFMGYFVEYRSEGWLEKGRNLLFLTGLSLICSVLNVHMNDLSYLKFGRCDYIEIFVPLYSLTVFSTVRYLCNRFVTADGIKKVLCFLGSGVFGTYLIEPQLREMFQPLYEKLLPGIGHYPALAVWLLVCMVMGITVINLLKKIPTVRSLL